MVVDQVQCCGLLRGAVPVEKIQQERVGDLGSWRNSSMGGVPGCKVWIMALLFIVVAATYAYIILIYVVTYDIKHLVHSCC